MLRPMYNSTVRFVQSLTVHFILFVCVCVCKRLNDGCDSERPLVLLNTNISECITLHQCVCVRYTKQLIQLMQHIETSILRVIFFSRSSSFLSLIIKRSNRTKQTAWSEMKIFQIDDGIHIGIGFDKFDCKFNCEC